MKTDARRLVFETHATSYDNEAGLASGHYDVDLSPTGEEQAAALGMRYAVDLPSVVVASDLRRSWRTAEIAFGTRVPVMRDARLRECDYGTLGAGPLARSTAGAWPPSTCRSPAARATRKRRHESRRGSTISSRPGRAAGSSSSAIGPTLRARSPVGRRAAVRRGRREVRVAARLDLRGPDS